MFLLSGSMHLSLEVLLTVGTDEEVSLTETERIQLLADAFSHNMVPCYFFHILFSYSIVSV
jgi:hypothetical protein